MKRVIVIILLWCACTSVFSQNADINLLKTINVNRNKNLDAGFKFLSNSVTPISIGTPILLYGLGHFHHQKEIKKKAIYIAEATLVAAFTSTALKYSVNRERPFDRYPGVIENAVNINSPSFPSGHTSSAFSTATSLSIAFPKWYVMVPAYAWASSVGYSRMHLGVHYPSDVFAGAIIGAGSAYLCHYLNQKFRSSEDQKFRSSEISIPAY